jgi:hypothetical protein
MRALGHLSNVDPITKTVAEVVGQWKEISAIPGELEAFGRALTSMAKDLGLSPAEFRALAAKGANAKRLDSMSGAKFVNSRRKNRRYSVIYDECVPSVIGNLNAIAT